MIKIEKENVVKVKHVVKVDRDAVVALATRVAELCKVTYATPEEELATLVIALEPTLQAIADKAWMLGKKITKANADEKDNIMYSANNPEHPCT